MADVDPFTDQPVPGTDQAAAPTAPPAAPATDPFTDQPLTPQGTPQAVPVMMQSMGEAAKDFYKKAVTTAQMGISGLLGIPHEIADWLGPSQTLKRIEENKKAGLPTHDFLLEMLGEDGDLATHPPPTVPASVPPHLWTSKEAQAAITKAFPDLPYEVATTPTGRVLQAGGAGAIAGAPFGAFGGFRGLMLGMLAGGETSAAAQTAAENNASPFVQNMVSSLMPFATAATAGLGGLAMPSPNRALARTLADVSEAEWQRAAETFRMAQQQGQRTTWSEALNEATHGRLKGLAALQRVAETTPGGAEVMGPIMAGRQPGNRAAFFRQTAAMPGAQPGQETIDVPTMLKNAAVRTVGQAYHDLRAVTRPAYEAAANETVDPGALRAITDRVDDLINNASTNSERAVLQNFRNDFTDTPAQPAATQVQGMQRVTTPAQPETLKTDIGRLDGLRKQWRNRIALADQGTQPGVPQPGQGGLDVAPLDAAVAAKLTPIVNQVRDLMTNTSQIYAYARAYHQATLEGVIKPMLRGPIGALAEEGGIGAPTLKGQRSIIMPTGEQQNLDAQTIRTVAQQLQRNDPSGQALSKWVRQNLESQFDFMDRDVGSKGEWTGAKFADRVLGGPGMQRANVNALLESLPNGAAIAEGMRNFFRILHAQSFREPSAAEGAAAMGQAKEELEAGRLPLTTFKPASVLRQRIDRWRYRVNARTLANMLTDPNMERQLRQLSGISPYSNQARTILLSMLGAQAATDNPPVPTAGEGP